MPSASQFSLLKSRRFLPYFITQALGAFNDNLYKNTLLLLIAFGGIVSTESSALYTNLAAGLFILPFFLFSPIAGQIADKYEKSWLIRQVKLLEIVIMLLGALAIITQQMLAMMALLFLMGLQSALFGPVKFALLPQTLSDKELLGGNALVETGTFLAILAGTILAAVLFDLDSARYWLGGGVVLFAVAGYLSARAVPEASATAPDMRINWNPFSEMGNTLRAANNSAGVFMAIIAISWFWFLGAAYLTQFANLTRDYLGGSAQMVTLLLTLFSVGVALGSLLCERLSGHHTESGIVPLGALGMSLAGIDLFFALNALPVTGENSVGAFLQQAGAWRVILDITLVSAFGGIFVVPLQTMIQQRSDPALRAQTIAANNLLNAVFMVLSAAAGIVSLALLQCSIAGFFLQVSVLNLLVCGLIFWRQPEFMQRFWLWLRGQTRQH